MGYVSDLKKYEDTIKQLDKRVEELEQLLIMLGMIA
jgi:hypothetical protein